AVAPTLAIVIPVGPGDTAWRGLLAQLENAGATAIRIAAARDDDQDFGGLPTSAALLRAPAGRARQLNAGAAAADDDWLWFLHADSRLAPRSLAAARAFVAADRDAIGYLDLRFLDDGPRLMALNAAGAWLRSRCLGLPFGDQGLLLPRRLFTALGRFPEDLPLGEDHALIWAARRHHIPVRPLRAPLYTSARRYAHRGWLATTARHLWLTLGQAHAFSRRERPR